MAAVQTKIHVSKFCDEFAENSRNLMLFHRKFIYLLMYLFILQLYFLHLLRSLICNIFYKSHISFFVWGGGGVLNIFLLDHATMIWIRILIQYLIFPHLRILKGKHKNEGLKKNNLEEIMTSARHGLETQNREMKNQIV